MVYMSTQTTLVLTVFPTYVFQKTDNCTFIENCYMYTPERTRELQKLSESLLKSKTSNLAQSLNSLREVLRFHEYRYYILNDPLLADAEYDHLYKALEKIEQEDPVSITPDSPTQRVGKGLTKDFTNVQHLVPMLSLENSYNADDLIDWDRKARELSGLQKLEYCVEPKFDGASISLIYENDLLARGATRGDGVYGDDITTNIKQIRSVPLSAPFAALGIQQIEIRGEVLLTKEHFKKYNDQLAAQNLPPLANPRNAAAGSLRIKDPKEVSRRNLEAFLYHVSYHIPVEGKNEPANCSLMVDALKCYGKQVSEVQINEREKSAPGNRRGDKILPGV